MNQLVFFVCMEKENHVKYAMLYNNNIHNFLFSYQNTHWISNETNCAKRNYPNRAFNGITYIKKHRSKSIAQSAIPHIMKRTIAVVAAQSAVNHRSAIPPTNATGGSRFARSNAIFSFSMNWENCASRNWLTRSFGGSNFVRSIGIERFKKIACFASTQQSGEIDHASRRVDQSGGSNYVRSILRNRAVWDRASLDPTGASIRERAASRRSIFFNRCFDKGRLKALITWYLLCFGQKKTVELVEKLKDLGFSNATNAGISLNVDDLKISPAKASLIRTAEYQTYLTSVEFEKGNLTSIERFQHLIDTWHRTSELLKQNVIDYFKTTDVLNPVYMMAFSGARGNISQVRQLVGMRGLMADPQGQIIDFPIQSNFREGLTLTEYVISCYGARKGLVDTALRTATSGYLTRRLVDVAQHVIVSIEDCQTSRGILLNDLVLGNKVILSLRARLVGRVLAEDLFSEKVQIGSRNQELTENDAFKISQIRTQVKVRSPLTCQAKNSVCQFCYGWSLATSHLVDFGEAIGVIAAQSIGEPGTQLTMRTFHTGGVFSADIMDQIQAPYNGQVHYKKPIEGSLTRTPYGKIAFLTKNAGQLIIVDERSESPGSPRFPQEIQISPYTLLFVRHKEQVVKNQLIGEFSSLTAQKNQSIKEQKNIFSEITGEVFFNNVFLYEKIIHQKIKKQQYLLSKEIIRESACLGWVWVLSAKRNSLTWNLFPNSKDLIFESQRNPKSISNSSYLLSINSHVPKSGAHNKSFGFSSISGGSSFARSLVKEIPNLGVICLDGCIDFSLGEKVREAQYLEEKKDSNDRTQFDPPNFRKFLKGPAHTNDRTQFDPPDFRNNISEANWASEATRKEQSKRNYQKSISPIERSSIPPKNLIFSFLLTNISYNKFNYFINLKHPRTIERSSIPQIQIPFIGNNVQFQQSSETISPRFPKIIFEEKKFHQLIRLGHDQSANEDFNPNSPNESINPNLPHEGSEFIQSSKAQSIKHSLIDSEGSPQTQFPQFMFFGEQDLVAMPYFQIQNIQPGGIAKQSVESTEPNFLMLLSEQSSRLFENPSPRSSEALSHQARFPKSIQNKEKWDNIATRNANKKSKYSVNKKLFLQLFSLIYKTKTSGFCYCENFYIKHKIIHLPDCFVKPKFSTGVNNIKRMSISTERKQCREAQFSQFTNFDQVHNGIRSKLPTKRSSFKSFSYSNQTSESLLVFKKRFLFICSYFLKMPFYLNSFEIQSGRLCEAQFPRLREHSEAQSPRSNEVRSSAFSNQLSRSTRRKAAGAMLRSEIELLRGAAKSPKLREHSEVQSPTSNIIVGTAYLNYLCSKPQLHKQNGVLFIDFSLYSQLDSLNLQPINKNKEKIFSNCFSRFNLFFKSKKTNGRLCEAQSPKTKKRVDERSESPNEKINNVPDDRINVTLRKLSDRSQLLYDQSNTKFFSNRENSNLALSSYEIMNPIRSFVFKNSILGLRKIKHNVFPLSAYKRVNKNCTSFPIDRTQFDPPNAIGFSETKPISPSDRRLIDSIRDRAAAKQLDLRSSSRRSEEQSPRSIPPIERHAIERSNIPANFSQYQFNFPKIKNWAKLNTLECRFFKHFNSDLLTPLIKNSMSWDAIEIEHLRSIKPIQPIDQRSIPSSESTQSNLLWKNFVMQNWFPLHEAKFPQTNNLNSTNPIEQHEVSFANVVSEASSIPQKEKQLKKVKTTKQIYKAITIQSKIKQKGMFDRTKFDPPEEPKIDLATLNHRKSIISVRNSKKVSVFADNYGQHYTIGRKERNTIKKSSRSFQLSEEKSTKLNESIRSMGGNERPSITASNGFSEAFFKSSFEQKPIARNAIPPMPISTTAKLDSLNRVSILSQSVNDCAKHNPPDASNLKQCWNNKNFHCFIVENRQGCIQNFSFNFDGWVTIQQTIKNEHLIGRSRLSQINPKIDSIGDRAASRRSEIPQNELIGRHKVSFENEVSEASEIPQNSLNSLCIRPGWVYFPSNQVGSQQLICGHKSTYLLGAHLIDDISFDQQMVYTEWISVPLIKFASSKKLCLTINSNSEKPIERSLTSPIDSIRDRAASRRSEIWGMEQSSIDPIRPKNEKTQLRTAQFPQSNATQFGGSHFARSFEASTKKTQIISVFISKTGLPKYVFSYSKIDKLFSSNQPKVDSPNLNSINPNAFFGEFRFVQSVTTSAIKILLLSLFNTIPQSLKDNTFRKNTKTNINSSNKIETFLANRAKLDSPNCANSNSLNNESKLIDEVQWRFVCGFQKYLKKFSKFYSNNDDQLSEARFTQPIDPIERSSISPRTIPPIGFKNLIKNQSAFSKDDIQRADSKDFEQSFIFFVSNSYSRFWPKKSSFPLFIIIRKIHSYPILSKTYFNNKIYQSIQMSNKNRLKFNKTTNCAKGNSHNFGIRPMNQLIKDQFPQLFDLRKTQKGETIERNENPSNVHFDGAKQHFPKQSSAARSPKRNFLYIKQKNTKLISLLPGVQIKIVPKIRTPITHIKEKFTKNLNSNESKFSVAQFGRLHPTNEAKLTQSQLSETLFHFLEVNQMKPLLRSSLKSNFSFNRATILIRSSESLGLNTNTRVSDHLASASLTKLRTNSPTKIKGNRMIKDQWTQFPQNEKMLTNDQNSFYNEFLKSYYWLSYSSETLKPSKVFSNLKLTKQLTDFFSQPSLLIDNKNVLSEKQKLNINKLKIEIGGIALHAIESGPQQIHLGDRTAFDRMSENTNEELSDNKRVNDQVLNNSNRSLDDENPPIERSDSLLNETSSVIRSQIERSENPPIEYNNRLREAQSPKDFQTYIDPNFRSGGFGFVQSFFKKLNKRQLSFVTQKYFDQQDSLKYKPFNFLDKQQFVVLLEKNYKKHDFVEINNHFSGDRAKLEPPDLTSINKENLNLNNILTNMKEDKIAKLIQNIFPLKAYHSLIFSNVHFLNYLKQGQLSEFRFKELKQRDHLIENQSGGLIKDQSPRTSWSKTNSFGFDQSKRNSINLNSQFLNSKSQLTVNLLAKHQNMFVNFSTSLFNFGPMYLMNLFVYVQPYNDTQNVNFNFSLRMNREASFSQLSTNQLIKDQFPHFSQAQFSEFFRNERSENSPKTMERKSEGFISLHREAARREAARSLIGREAAARSSRSYAPGAMLRSPIESNNIPNYSKSISPNPIFPFVRTTFSKLSQSSFLTTKVNNKINNLGDLASLDRSKPTNENTSLKAIDHNTIKDLTREVLRLNKNHQSQIITLNESDHICLSTFSKKPLITLGNFLQKGSEIAEGVGSTCEGQIISIQTSKITVRHGKPIFFLKGGIFHVNHGNFVDAKSSLITLSYQRLKTEDIVQGIPKIEEFFEARQTDQLHLFFEKAKNQYALPEAVRKSLEIMQQIIVNGVQSVYQSQGVNISDKHVEIIVRQMTSKVRIVEGGNTGLLKGELVLLDWIELINFGTYGKKAQYEPVILGITKAALETESFISAASFQETTRILSRAAIENKVDFLRGLKENVILGHFIPAGTGFSRFF
uniref:DNA-directed RNA polymerase subunit beta'' n=3 Tax=Eukaryota TaxID=2759 RepID=A0A1W6EGX3_9CHLO|nr:beta'' subunit of RNA polymerase [Pseudocharacium americanum]YP_009367692.1 beta'' subunit of RNA polymerase [Ignatius tetrasporus]ARK14605.1 beta'' subunit of RNA polymerase [Pseudocharacium americanum]ARK14694.1 beta'' subunit of RNA polymerase [Ignatius tetrasporus]